jgi:hypothetical protein
MTQTMYTKFVNINAYIKCAGLLLKKYKSGGKVALNREY